MPSPIRPGRSCRLGPGRGHVPAFGWKSVGAPRALGLVCDGDPACHSPQPTRRQGAVSNLGESASPWGEPAASVGGHPQAPSAGSILPTPANRDLAPRRRPRPLARPRSAVRLVDARGGPRRGPASGRMAGAARETSGRETRQTIRRSSRVKQRAPTGRQSVGFSHSRPESPTRSSCPRSGDVPPGWPQHAP